MARGRLQMGPSGPSGRLWGHAGRAVPYGGAPVPSASGSPAPSAHTSAVRPPGAQAVVVGVAACKALRALAGFVLAGPFGAFAGAASWPGMRRMPDGQRKCQDEQGGMP